MSDNKDLTENRIPFGLLEPDVKERMQNWPHGLEVWNWNKGWSHNEMIWGLDYVVYRAIPAPVERVTRWGNVHLNAFGNVLIYDYDSREVADDNTNTNRRIAVLRVTYDKHTGENPVIEVEEL